MSAVTITHVSRTAALSVLDAPPTEGASGYSGKTRTVRAENVRTTEGSPTVVLHGPQVREDGTETASWYEVKVTLDADERLHPQAPQWVRDVVARVWA